MKYARIVVKNNYEKKGDLVLRSYIRALRKINAKLLLEGDNAVILGLIQDDGKFHELFTNEVIDYDKYEINDMNNMLLVASLSNKEVTLIKKIIEHVIFGKKVEFDYDFEISTMEDLAIDRSVEFDAYNNFLSGINPYMRLSEREEQKRYNAYNNFLIKLNELKKQEKQSNLYTDFDEYDINNYREIPHEETDAEEYLVFDFSKKLVRK